MWGDAEQDLRDLPMRLDGDRCGKTKMGSNIIRNFMFLCRMVAQGMQARCRGKTVVIEQDFILQKQRTLQTQDKSEKQKVKWIIITTMLRMIDLPELLFKHCQARMDVNVFSSRCLIFQRVMEFS